MSNITVARQGESSARVHNMDDIISQQANLKQISDATTNGVNNLRAIPNKKILSDINIDDVTKKAKDIREKYMKIAKEGTERAKSPSISGSDHPKENYDLNVDPDIEKRVKDNLRDESKIERPYDFSKMKPFSKVKANLFMKLKKVESLLKQTKDRNQRNRLHYLEAKISNDLSKMATMESGKWLNPDSKTEKDPDKDYEKFMKPENTGEQKNTLNDELKKATLNAWSISPKIKKQAMEQFDKVQVQNIEQAITELDKNNEEYKQDIELLEAAIGKKAEVSDEDKERIAKIEKNAEENEDDEKDNSSSDKDEDEKKEDKKDDGKDKDKDSDNKDKKEKKDDKKDNKKKDIKEKMREMRDKRMKGKPKTDEERLNTHKEIHPEDGIENTDELPPRGTGLKESKPMPIKDDLTAIFTRKNTKTASIWEVQDNDKNVILSFNGSDAYGKKIFANWDFFRSKEYGKELVSRIRQDGIEKMADLLNAKFEMTKHAKYIEKKAKGDEDDKEKEMKKKKEEKAKKEKEEKEAKEKKKKEEKARKEKNAKASPEVNNYFNKYLSKGSGEVPGFKGKIKERVNKTTDKMSNVSNKKSSIKAFLENIKLKKKVASLEDKLKKESTDKQDLESEKVLRAKAEKAIKLANMMLNKKIIKAEDLEKTVERLTVMDDLSYNMMEGFVGDSDFNEKVSENIEKKAFKQKGGLKNLLLIPHQEKTLQDKFTNMFMGKAKYAKLQKGLDDLYSK